MFAVQTITMARTYSEVQRLRFISVGITLVNI
jgi:hypothetical protein